MCVQAVQAAGSVRAGRCRQCGSRAKGSAGKRQCAGHSNAEPVWQQRCAVCAGQGQVKVVCGAGVVAAKAKAGGVVGVAQCRCAGQAGRQEGVAEARWRQAVQAVVVAGVAVAWRRQCEAVRARGRQRGAARVRKAWYSARRVWQAGASRCVVSVRSIAGTSMAK